MTTLKGSPQDISSRLAANADVMNLRLDSLRIDIERMYSSLIKWVIGIWLTLAIILVTPLFAILDRLPKHCSWG